MHGQLLKFSKAKGFNSLSWNEEQQKESSRDVWRSLYQYEDVSEINGTLQAFTIGLNDDGKLDLNNSSFVQSLKNRLGKAKHFFVSSANEKLREEQKRSALLSLGDYSMCRLNHEGFATMALSTVPGKILPAIINSEAVTVLWKSLT